MVGGGVCLGVCSGARGAEAETLNISVCVSSHRDEAPVPRPARFAVREEAEGERERFDAHEVSVRIQWSLLCRA